jgi:polyhydroxyalkanoate synthase
MATATAEGDGDGRSTAAAEGDGDGRSTAAAEADEAGRSAAGGDVGLDALLTDAALGRRRRWLPGRAGAQLALRLATRPRSVARRGAQFAGELGKVAVGRSELEPAKRDRRFKDPAWSGNPAFRRLEQAYLATGQAADRLICDCELGWQDERRVRFAVENVMDALAPTNFPLANPAAIKAALDSGGGNFVRGAGHLARDLRRPPRLPQMVDESAFEVGDNIG